MSIIIAYLNFIEQQLLCAHPQTQKLHQITKLFFLDSISPSLTRVQAKNRHLQHDTRIKSYYLVCDKTATCNTTNSCFHTTRWLDFFDT